MFFLMFVFVCLLAFKHMNFWVVFLQILQLFYIRELPVLFLNISEINLNISELFFCFCKVLINIRLQKRTSLTFSNPKKVNFSNINLSTNR